MPDASDAVRRYEAQADQVRQKPVEQHSSTPLLMHISFPYLSQKLSHNSLSSAFTEHGADPAWGADLRSLFRDRATGNRWGFTQSC